MIMTLVSREIHIGSAIHDLLHRKKEILRANWLRKIQSALRGVLLVVVSHRLFFTVREIVGTNKSREQDFIVLMIIHWD